MTLQIRDDNRVRTLTLNRPDVLNAFNEELYHATALALRDAAADSEVAVVLLTGAGRAFSAGHDLNEMHRRITDPAFNSQDSHFATMIDALTELPKPPICGVNGVGVGISAWKVCEPDDLLPEARRHAEIPASRPISSLMAVKQTITEPVRQEIAAATAREISNFAELLGAAANADALAEFTQKRTPN
ncbi:MAG TPA: enoyl-CoA hydratase-related protein [Mycobacterium sp.]|nr:enoyl-CoA hydratase-related protein [Mycobacterium sp.]